MAPDVHLVPEHALETAWFDAPRRSSRPPQSSPPFRTLPPPLPPQPPAPIDDAIADEWFR